MAHIVRVHADHARAIGIGHPWVFRQAVAQKPAGLKPGDVVELATETRAFLGRGVFEGDSSVPVRVWTRDAAERLDGDLVRTRLRQAIGLRKAAGVPSRSGAWRVVNSEGDRMPGIVIDRWGEYTSVTLQGGAMQSRAWGERVLTAVMSELPSRGVYFRDDDMAQLVAGSAAPDDLWVREPSGEFLVRITKPGKPGLFTDMREVRAALAPMLQGKSFLNLFAHTGAFSGMAAAAGATEVVDVDLSKNFLETSRANVERNTPAGGGLNHEVIAADVFETLRGLASQDRVFDAVLVDPPTFSSSKKSGAFNVKDEYRPLIRASLRVLKPGGLLVAATNFRGMDREDFLRMLHDAAEVENADLRILAAMGQPVDYPSVAMVPETRHLEVAVCGKAGIAG